METKNKNQLRYIMYCRKSTDSEDRQVQSIEDQEKELYKIVQQKGLKVVKKFGESQSAKYPGRSMFNEMMRMLECGEADGVLCWKINRLARNPKDGGGIQWFLQTSVIKSIITPYKEHLPADNVLLLAVELGVANQFSIDLSNDVKRGLSSKVDKGWKPGKAPIGYLNDKIGDKGNKKIFEDTQRFLLVRKMWDLLLTGNYSVPRIVKIATDEWGLRTKENKKMSLSGVYRMFTNPFYYGEYYWNGEIRQGKHKKMITPEEFDRAQVVLGKAGRPRPKSKRLPFNGVIVCSECGGMVTCDEKVKQVKSIGKTKHYLYHRCSKRKRDKACYQKPITHQDLVEQVKGYLDKITIPEEFLGWALELLRDNNRLEETNRNEILKNHHTNYQDCVKRIDNLIDLYISPDNASRELLSEEEYKSQKNTLTKEKSLIESEMRKIEERVDDWLELTERTFNFATYAKSWFEKGDYEYKTSVLQALGQNFGLKDGKLDISLKEPLLVLKEGLEAEPLKKARLEPQTISLPNGKNTVRDDVFSVWSG